MRWTRRLLCGGLAMLLAAMAGQAVPTMDAEPVPDYPITPQAGPWVICAASFTGPEAPELARQMVGQIRGRWSLPAYVFNRANEERLKQQKEEADRIQQQNPLFPQRRRRIQIEEQCAVLVGGYPDPDSARKALSKVKELPPPQLKTSSGRPALDTVYEGSESEVAPDPVRKGSPNGAMRLQVQKQREVNPFTTAFVTRNPAIPQSQSGSRVDPLWWKLNRDNPYNLLDCKKSWTLVVKQYSGAKTLVAQEASSSSFLGKLWPSGTKAGETLDAAALTAQELARVLRQLNFQAYVLHTRTSSVVTIGGFAAPDDPDLMRVRQQLAALQERFRTAGRDPFTLYPNPVPMEVPRLQ